MSSARPDSVHVDPFGPDGSSRWAASEAQRMEALFAPVPDPRTGYPAPYGAEHHTSVHQAPGQYAPGQYAPDPHGPGQYGPEQYDPGPGGVRRASVGGLRLVRSHDAVT